MSAKLQEKITMILTWLNIKFIFNIYMTHKREDNFDLTKFLKNNDVRVIANPEGFDIAKLISKDGEQNNIQNAKAIICGNIMDSTNNKGNDGKTFNEVLKNKSFNLKNLIKIKNNPNIKVILGNRDLNKIKIYNLTELQVSGVGERWQEVINFNNCNLQPNIDNYLKLVSQLKSSLTTKNTYVSIQPWVINGMDKYYPFWFDYFTDKMKGNSYQYPFLGRFIEIFKYIGAWFN